MSLISLMGLRRRIWLATQVLLGQPLIYRAAFEGPLNLATPTRVVECSQIFRHDAALPLQTSLDRASRYAIGPDLASVVLLPTGQYESAITSCPADSVPVLPPEQEGEKEPQMPDPTDEGFSPATLCPTCRGEMQLHDRTCVYYPTRGYHYYCLTPDCGSWLPLVSTPTEPSPDRPCPA